MAINNTAFVKDINPNTSSADEHLSVHQTGPAWVLTFLRWEIRDTLRTNPYGKVNSTTISPPLVVENDCIQLTVSDSKTTLTPSMSATLLMTDVNYETEVAPGDFVFVNMLNWESHARKVANQARAMDPINGVHDGFKGFFKVASVRKSLMVDPQSGTKTYAIKVTAFAFTEFNNSIYFNPYLVTKEDNNLLLFASLIGIDWAHIQAEKSLVNIQSVIRALIQSFIGVGFTNNGRKPQAGLFTSNTHFYMPQGVGNLLNQDSAVAAKDVYNFLFGIQSYSSGANQTLAQGMNPTGVDPDQNDEDRFIFLADSVEGITVAKPEYWNQNQAWSILNQFVNSPLNEMYTCFRIAPNGYVMPTVVLRQIPFTTDNFDIRDGSNKVTRFMNLPRWNINPSLAFSFDLGRDDVARKNFVQYFGRSVNGPAGYDISDEIARNNYLYDIEDVQRNGLRPFVVTSEFDRFPDIKPGEQVSAARKSFRAPGWARIVGDALIGGHLKFSGTINYVGIPEPIAVGDNLQFDNVVYHIEQMTHSCSIAPNGIKQFRTTILVSNGMDIENGSQVIYSEMAFGGADDKRQNDFDTTKILPGVSESQDTVYRHAPNNPDTPISDGESFTEPNTKTSISKSTRTQ